MQTISNWKKSRKEIKNFYFNIEYNFTKNEYKINNLIFDPGNIKSENELFDYLDESYSQGKIDTWIEFKNFVNKVFVDYYDG